MTPIPKRYSINHKILTILFLTVVCYVPTLFIGELVQDRAYYQDRASDTQQLHLQPKEVLLQDYQAITRVTKYSLLFITLTFSLFFLFEVLAQVKIHPVNYGLVGLALGVFYLMLLSFTEVIGFIPAYIAAATAVVALICTYIVRTLGSWAKTGMLAALLTLLYGYLLVLLQLEQYSLLFGSLLVFGTLATIMLCTREVNWYDV